MGLPFWAFPCPPWPSWPSCPSPECLSSAFGRRPKMSPKTGLFWALKWPVFGPFSGPFCPAGLRPAGIGGPNQSPPSGGRRPPEGGPKNRTHFGPCFGLFLGPSGLRPEGLNFPLSFGLGLRPRPKEAQKGPYFGHFLGLFGAPFWGLGPLCLGSPGLWALRALALGFALGFGGFGALLGPPGGPLLGPWPLRGP